MIASGREIIAPNRPVIIGRAGTATRRYRTLKKGTGLVRPTHHFAAPGDDYFIDNGSSILVRLPKGEDRDRGES
jgi:hypothetical protein